MENRHYTKEQAELLEEFKKKAEMHGYEYFAVIGDSKNKTGASIFGGVKDAGDSAVRNVRDAHIEWELKHGIDPNHDRGEDTCHCGSGLKFKKCHGK